ncbi:ATP-binding protein [Sphingobacterium sp. T2]|uniref:ATP-binding protein n=1 Tax=Sphingobacterium sp. T2 TaxID=1590596 RepID=UPI00057BA567|nr:ATP-binding protein [Sphingobacterium sp. T2]
MIKSFGRDNLKVLIVGNDDVWSFVKPVIKKELFPIIQELMVNMNKHSGATEVILKFQIEEGQLSLSYSDNGVGLPHDNEKRKWLDKYGKPY